jgi:murein DD-endopeptidase MepM/ murein hydrolase activator NlpD
MVMMTNLRHRARKLLVKLTRFGRSFPLRRYFRHVVLLVLIVLGAWAAQLGLSALPVNAGLAPLEVEPTVVDVDPQDLDLSIADLPPFAGGPYPQSDIGRTVEVHTVFPSRPRLNVITYEVKAGDSLFGIADQFGLKPETILWGNFDVLQDNPHSINPGDVLNISPVDGILHFWSAGESLSGVADFYEASLQEIIDWPGNEIAPDIDLEESEIEPGQVVVIPGGSREYVSWTAPRIPRSNPSVASILGPGACGSIYDGPIGFGSFIWPTANRYLSGYDYSPATNHYGIDVAGATGHTIWAMDAGVVVYAGWHNGGYGNVLVLDHGNGWQTLYAHLSAINVGCGAGVFQGTAIGAMGSTGRSTGPHLHLEMRHDIYGRVNPWLYLP